MSALVLAVGALLVLAGAYEMVTGSGDILSERGWSAYIAGSVLIAGGIVTLSLGLVVRMLDRLRGALLHGAAPFAGTTAMDRREANPYVVDAPMSPTAPMPEHEALFEPAPTAPVLASPPIEPAEAEPVRPIDATPSREAETTAAEPARDDWLDHSFADLEREMAVRHEDAGARPTAEAAIEPARAEPVHETPVHEAPAHEEPAYEASVHEAPLYETPVREAPLYETLAYEPAPRAPEPEMAALEPETNPDVEPAHPERATVSAREEPPPSDSAVIGRYESEGTSYVMYADGSIDAQSEAGVYRFASMAELKTFIES